MKGIFERMECYQKLESLYIEQPKPKNGSLPTSYITSVLAHIAIILLIFHIKTPYKEELSNNMEVYEISEKDLEKDILKNNTTTQLANNDFEKENTNAYERKQNDDDNIDILKEFKPSDLAIAKAKGQIVETAEPLKPQLPPTDAKFLSSSNNSVVKETVSKVYSMNPSVIAPQYSAERSLSSNEENSKKDHSEATNKQLNEQSSNVKNSFKNNLEDTVQGKQLRDNVKENNETSKILEKNNPENISKNDQKTIQNTAENKIENKSETKALQNSNNNDLKENKNKETMFDDLQLASKDKNADVVLKNSSKDTSKEVSGMNSNIPKDKASHNNTANTANIFANNSLQNSTNKNNIKIFPESLKYGAESYLSSSNTGIIDKNLPKGDLKGSPSNDRVRVASSDQTMLNTREFKYFGYMQKIRRQVNFYWSQSLDNIGNINERLTKSEYTTVLNIIVDKGGKLQTISIARGSGVRVFDDATLKAFQLAAPFPPPPEGLLNEFGVAEMPIFEFTVTLGKGQGVQSGSDPRANVRFPGLIRSQ